MGVIYFPLLLVAAVFETQAAKDIRANRARGDDDDDTIEEWEQMQGEVDFEGDGWNKTVSQARTNLDVDATVDEVQKLRAEVEKLSDLVLQLAKTIGKGGDGGGNVNKSALELSRSSTAVAESQATDSGDGGGHLETAPME